MDTKTKLLKWALPMTLAALVLVIAVAALQQERIRQIKDNAGSNTQVQQPLSNDVGKDAGQKDLKTIDTAKDSRKLWAYGNREVGCDAKFNGDAPTTSVKYSSKAMGIEMVVPYNPEWGTDKYRLNPFESVGGEDNELIFGPLSAFEGCGWIRTLRMTSATQQSAADVIQGIRTSDNGYSPGMTKQINLNGLTAVQYQLDGLCTTGRLEIIGKKFNYIFDPVCGAVDSPGFKQILETAKTIKFID